MRSAANAGASTAGSRPLSFAVRGGHAGWCASRILRRAGSGQLLGIVLQSTIFQIHTTALSRSYCFFRGKGWRKLHLKGAKVMCDQSMISCSYPSLFEHLVVFAILFFAGSILTMCINLYVGFLQGAKEEAHE